MAEKESGSEYSIAVYPIPEELVPAILEFVRGISPQSNIDQKKLDVRAAEYKNLTISRDIPEAELLDNLTRISAKYGKPNGKMVSAVMNSLGYTETRDVVTRELIIHDPFPAWIADILLHSETIREAEDEMDRIETEEQTPNSESTLRVSGIHVSRFRGIGVTHLSYLREALAMSAVPDS